MLQKQTATGCGPGGSGCRKLTGWKHPLNTAAAAKFQPSPIRAELTGSSTCTALGLSVRANSPVLGLCRRLIEAGYDPATPLQAYRGDTLCLVIRSIGEAAALEINSAGTGFFRHRGARAASPVRQKAVGHV
jgi:hypothetical protein